MMNAPIDETVVTIGRLYRQAQTSSENRIFYLADAGNRLLKKKELLGHGQWLQWIRENHNVLGFADRGARSLIQGAQWMASNWQLADALEEIITNPTATVEDIARADEIRQLISGQFRPTLRGTLGRRRNEWYTPREYISLARAVLGDIDTDPASSERAQQVVKARQFFDQKQNGLHQAWHGRVWLNPPYSRSLIGKFVAKLLMEWDAGRISACIALTHNYTDTAWFQDAASAANVVCFTQGRVRFYEPDGVVAKPTQGQAFFYFGPDTDAFKHEFGRVGFIVRPEPDSWTRRRVRDEA